MTGGFGAQGIRSLEKGAHLLKLLSEAKVPMRLCDLAKGAHMTNSAAHGYMVSLIRTGLVAQDKETGLYDLGRTALQLGLAALSRVDFLRLGQETLRNLAAELGATAVLAVWSEKGPVVVAKVDDYNEGSFYEVRIGRIVSLTPTSSGRTFMAYLPDQCWRHLLELSGQKSEAALERELAAIRKNGFAVGHPSTLAEAAAISAPVFDHTDALRGVLTVIGHAGRFDIRPHGANATAIRRAARSFSERLGSR